MEDWFREWLDVDQEALKGTVKVSQRDEIDVPVKQVMLIVELYSK